MPQLKVSLSIGIHNAGQEDVLEIDQDEWDDCETQDVKDALMEEYWRDWSNNYIDGIFELIED